MTKPIIVDRRNIFEPLQMKKLGFEYYPTGWKQNAKNLLIEAFLHLIPVFAFVPDDCCLALFILANFIDDAIFYSHFYQKEACKKLCSKNI